MNPNKINNLLTFNEKSLENITISQRNTLLDIEKKIEHFFKKNGLNIVLLTGLRGTGKTTILKTIAKKYNGMYTSGDFLKTNSINIEDISEIAKTHNYKIIIIDEILYLSDWQIKLKIDADINQKTLYIISGSSAMQLKKITQDLSRRLDYYKLNPLSFKEFLKIKKNITVDVNLDIKTFSQKKKDLFLELSRLKNKLPKNLFLLFKEYYTQQLPFILEEENKTNKINQLVEKIIYKDMPQIDNLYSQHLKNAEIIIKYLTTTEKLNYTSVSNNLDIKRDLVIKIIDLLEKSEIISIIPDIVPTRELRGNKKILFAGPSIRLALNEINLEKVIGFSREDMFGLILKNSDIKYGYNYKQDGFDFLVNNIKFEIGNNKKKIPAETVVVGDFMKVDFKKDVLFVPFYIFSLINK